MSRSVAEQSALAMRKVNAAMRNMLDVAGVPDGSELESRVHGALEELYGAMREIRKTAKHKRRLNEPGPLVYPLQGQDMRKWPMSDGRTAAKLLPSNSRQAVRIASARKVKASPALNYYRAMTASQYLEALEDAVLTERPESSDAGPDYPEQSGRWTRVGLMV